MASKGVAARDQIRGAEDGQDVQGSFYPFHLQYSRLFINERPPRKCVLELIQIRCIPSQLGSY